MLGSHISYGLDIQWRHLRGQEERRKSSDGRLSLCNWPYKLLIATGTYWLVSGHLPQHGFVGYGFLFLIVGIILTEELEEIVKELSDKLKLAAHKD